MIKSESIIPLLTVCANSENAGCARVGELSIEIINRQKSDIEGLTAKILAKDNINAYNTAQLRIARKELRTAKTEAIKKFAERLTDNISVYSKYVDFDGIVILNRIYRMIEDIEKEMTEVQK